MIFKKLDKLKCYLIYHLIKKLWLKFKKNKIKFL